MPGICTSSSTAANGSRCSASSDSAPEAATATE